MNKDKIVKELQEIMSPEFKVLSIDNVNHTPHRYMIGPKHVKYASEHYGGMLGTETCEKVSCAMPNCNYSYAEHKSDTVLCIQLTRNLKPDEAQGKMKAVVGILEANNIDGFTLVDTPEKFRITD